MKLQISVDLLCLEQAITLLQDVAPFVDIIEVGSALLKQQGVTAIAAVKEKFPDKLIAANMKIVSAGGLEADMAFRAGASFTNVLAIASDSTIAGALSSARKYQRTIVADMMLISDVDLARRARELQVMGIDHFMVYCDLDDHLRSLTPETMARLTSLRQLTSVVLIAAGNINQKVIAQLKTLDVEIGIFGSVIYASPFPKEVARKLRQAIDHI